MAVTYSYSYDNLANIDNAYSTEDYGLISSDSTSNQDFGETSDTPDNPPNTNEFDWYSISINESLIPFGSFSSFSSGQERVTYSYVPSGLLFNFATQSVVDNVTFTWVGNGTLFEIGNGLERTLRPYVSSGTLRLGEESEAIISSSTLSLVSTLTTSVSGIALESETDVYVGIGTIFVSQELVHPNIDYTPAYSGTGIINISGSLIIQNNYSYSSSGTLFGFGEKFESRVYLYDLEDFVEYISFDYGFISSEPTQFSEDYGDLDPASGSNDYGIIIDEQTGTSITETLFPFGSLFISGISSTKEIQVYGNDYVTSGKLTLSGKPLIHPDVDYTPALTGSGLFNLSGTLVEKNTESYVGLGTLTASGSALEAYSAQTPEDTQLFIISGTALEAYSAQTPKDTQLFIISGELVHPNIDYTPSLTGFGLVNLSGSIVEKNTESYVGLGTLFVLTLDGVYNFNLEYVTTETPSPITLSDTLVEKVNYSYTGIGSIFTTIFSRNYSNVYPGLGGNLPNNPGIGTIRINDDSKLTITRAEIPVIASGIVTIFGSGFENFGYTNYNGSGITTILGFAESRVFNTYTYSGIGSVFISQQTAPIKLKEINSYSGSGSIILSDQSEIITTYDYTGTGSLFELESVEESITFEPFVSSVLYTISGFGLESYVIQPDEDKVLYEFSGNITEKVSVSYQGVGGSSNLNGVSSTFYIPSYSGNTLFKFTTKISDDDTITCDSDEVTCDNLFSASVTFVSNPPENTQLFEIYGSSITNKVGVYTYEGYQNIELNGEFTNLQISKSIVGFGTIFTALSTLEKDTDTYIGSGTIFSISGSSESYSTQTPDSVILLNINGSAETRKKSEYSTVGIGLLTLSEFALTKVISNYTQNGSGFITISGELLHPNIQFIPSAFTSGFINILGSSNNSITKPYESYFGTLFNFGSGFESFSKPTYVGIGSLYILETSGSTINNPYQIPRTYTVII